jgi:hopanoid-associated phosphorylase
MTASPKAVPPRLGVLVGLAAEARLVQRYLPPGFDVVVELSGARIERAHAAAARLLQAEITHMLSFGYAGGLSEALTSGTLLVPSEVRTLGRAAFAANREWHRTVIELLGPPAPITLPLLGSDVVVDTPEQKARLSRETGTASVDMESHIAAAAAASRGLPFLAIRVVIDSADHPVPRAAISSLRTDGSVDLLALLGALARQPRQVPGMITLGRDAGRARKSLLRCSRRCGLLGFGVG